MDIYLPIRLALRIRTRNPRNFFACNAKHNQCRINLHTFWADRLQSKFDLVKSDILGRRFKGQYLHLRFSFKHIHFMITLVFKSWSFGLQVCTICDKWHLYMLNYKILTEKYTMDLSFFKVHKDHRIKKSSCFHSCNQSEMASLLNSRWQNR